jgi:putative two-component system response regulator
LGRVSQCTSDLDAAAAIIMTVTAMNEARESSPGHCYRMANYATALGRAMHLGGADLKALYRGAFLHDIGMLAIPDDILHKGGRLEPEEYAIIKSHPVIGDALCANLRTLHPVRPIVRHHHERLDGSGYPDGLQGDRVPLLAQIVSIVDLFEAITMGRQYVEPRSAADAILVLRHEAQLGWRHADLVDRFAALVMSGALERFRGPSVEAPAELESLATHLQQAAAVVLAPEPRAEHWAPH